MCDKEKDMENSICSRKNTGVNNEIFEEVTRESRIEGIDTARVVVKNQDGEVLSDQRVILLADLFCD